MTTMLGRAGLVVGPCAPAPRATAASITITKTVRIIRNLFLLRAATSLSPVRRGEGGSNSSFGACGDTCVPRVQREHVVCLGPRLPLVGHRLCALRIVRRQV